MKCRAIICCTAGGENDTHGRSRGDRCDQEATEHLGSTKLPPSLCWVHAKAIVNPHRLSKLALVPLSAEEVAAQFARQSPQRRS